MNCVHSSCWLTAAHVRTIRTAAGRLARLQIHLWITPDFRRHARTPSGNLYRPHRWSPPTVFSVVTALTGLHADSRWSARSLKNPSRKHPHRHKPEPSTVQSHSRFERDNKQQRQFTPDFEQNLTESADRSEAHRFVVDNHPDRVFLPEHDGCKGCLKCHQHGSLRLKESISDQMVSAQTASETMVSSR